MRGCSIEEITTADVLEIVQRLKGAGKIEQARRIKQAFGQIFRFGIMLGVCKNDPSYALRGIVTSKNARNYPAITDPQEIGALLRAIDMYAARSPVFGSALKLHAYVFVRPGELRHAEWSEIDWDKKYGK